MVKQMKFPGLKTNIYYIFSDGRIWSKRKKGFLLLNQLHDGYPMIKLHLAGKTKGGSVVYIHKLMEYNFMDMSLRSNFKDPTVDHIDSVKTNNRIENLRYLERSDNTRRGKHYKNVYHHHKLNPEDIHGICKMLLCGIKMKDIANTYNISYATISRIKVKKAWRWISELYF